MREIRFRSVPSLVPCHLSKASLEQVVDYVRVGVGLRLQASKLAQFLGRDSDFFQRFCHLDKQRKR